MKRLSSPEAPRKGRAGMPRSGSPNLVGGGVDQVGPGDGLCGRPVGEDGANERAGALQYPDGEVARGLPRPLGGCWPNQPSPL